MHRLVYPVILACLLPGCSSVKVWPFDDKGGGTSQPSGPKNATLYQCDAGKRFYLRNVDANNVWLIYPDREVALGKDGAGTRYSNGVAVLVVNGDTATLTDGSAINYTNCKAAAKK